MLEYELAAVVLIFVVAGLVKGTIGFGLPTVAIGLMTALFGLRDALVIMLIPAFVTNVWQAASGPALRELALRLWPMMTTGMVAIWFAVGILVKSDALWFSALLGCLMCLYSAYSLVGPKIEIPPAKEKLVSLPVGLVTGILSGLTGNYIIPAGLYLQCLGLDRDRLVQALGMWFTLANAALFVSLGSRSALPLELVLISTVAIVPAMLGMLAGRRIRARITDARFTTLFFAGIALLGVFLVVRALAVKLG